MGQNAETKTYRRAISDAFAMGYHDAEYRLNSLRREYDTHLYFNPLAGQIYFAYDRPDYRKCLAEYLRGVAEYIEHEWQG